LYQAAASGPERSLCYTVLALHCRVEWICPRCWLDLVRDLKDLDPGNPVMRPDTPQPLTRDEHLELGRELKRARVKLHELASLVVDVYGAQNQATLTFQKLIATLDTLTEDLQAQAAEDLHGQRVSGFYTGRE